MVKLYNPVYEVGDTVDVIVTDPVERPPVQPPRFIGESKLPAIDRTNMMELIARIRHSGANAQVCDIDELCDNAEKLIEWVDRASDVCSTIHDELQRLRTDEGDD